jgi:signal transduction histidine kinase
MVLRDMSFAFAASFSDLVSRLTAAWRGLSLIRKFSLIALLVIGSGTSLIGAWVARSIEEAVVQNSASSAALYLGGLVEPIVGSVEPDGTLTPEQIRRLDELLTSKAFGKSIVSMKIWVDGAKVAYSNHKQLIGQRFTLAGSLQSAWSGSVSGEYNQLNESENQVEHELGIPLLEIYAPLRAADGSRVLAVGELYSRADHLKADLAAARMGSWMIVGLGSLAMFGALYGLVLQAGKTIIEQQGALRQQVVQLSEAVARNGVLSRQVDEANSRSVVMNDRFLRRVGAELHDGPAQLLAYALLRLDSAVSAAPVAAGAKSRTTDVETLRKVLTDTLKDIRNISGGLSLPEIQNMPLGRALELCAQSHERRTASRVKVTAAGLAHDVSTATKICLYRFVQEALNNAFRHAGGAGQVVALTYRDGAVSVTVSDTGPGFDPASTLQGERLGLAGLRDRVLSLGGTFQVQSVLGKGTQLTTSFTLAAKGRSNV